jgi:hypothetical protein
MINNPTNLGPAVAARELAARVELGLLLGRCHSQDVDPVRELEALAELADAIRQGKPWQGEILGSDVAVHPASPPRVAEPGEDLDEAEGAEEPLNGHRRVRGVRVSTKGRELLAAARGAA